MLSRLFPAAAQPQPGEVPPETPEAERLLADIRHRRSELRVLEEELPKVGPR